MYMQTTYIYFYQLNLTVYRKTKIMWASLFKWVHGIFKWMYYNVFN